jgi:hypothetical protein
MYVACAIHCDVDTEPYHRATLQTTACQPEQSILWYNLEGVPYHSKHVSRVLHFQICQ